MKPEKQNLIRDVLGEDGRREATLLAGGRILRRRRCWRMVSRGLVIILVLSVTAICFEKMGKRATHTVIPIVASMTATQPQALTDDQLLALFPETPVGLVTLADGRKRLIFPHSGDEEKYITPL